MLENKKILIGVTGGIAAYKAALLIRLLVKEKAEVKVIMTPNAHEFIGALTLATLSKNAVYTEFVKGENGEWVNHVELGLWADAFIIAPCTASTLGKCANGISDNLLVATYLSARCPVFFAPAMDLDMYKHQTTLENIGKLKTFKNTIIDAADGELASGLSGKGRMAEPEHIVECLKQELFSSPKFKNKKILITSGPTQEALDPVRFISNHSTGKMGLEIAKAFAYAGAQVTMVSGPSSNNKHFLFNTIEVKSAEEMLTKVTELFSKADIIIYTAAVADYTPKEVSDQKIKKKSSEFVLELKKTVDIAASMKKSKGQITVGFALETQNALENAKGKLKKKNFDLLVLNSLQDKGAGFRYNTNKVTILFKNGDVKEYSLKTKTEVAADILTCVETIL